MFRIIYLDLEMKLYETSSLFPHQKLYEMKVLPNVDNDKSNKLFFLNFVQFSTYVGNYNLINRISVSRSLCVRRKI